MTGRTICDYLKWVKSFWILYSKLLYKFGQDFLDIQYNGRLDYIMSKKSGPILQLCPYVNTKLLYKIGQDFLDI